MKKNVIEFFTFFLILSSCKNTQASGRTTEQPLSLLTTKESPSSSTSTTDQYYYDYEEIEDFTDLDIGSRNLFIHANVDKNGNKIDYSYVLSRFPSAAIIHTYHGLTHFGANFPSLYEYAKDSFEALDLENYSILLFQYQINYYYSYFNLRSLLKYKNIVFPNYDIGLEEKCDKEIIFNIAIAISKYPFEYLQPIKRSQQIDEIRKLEIY